MKIQKNFTSLFALFASFLSFLLATLTFADNIEIYKNDHKNQIVIQSDIAFGTSTNLFFGDDLSHYLQWDSITNAFVFSDNVDFNHNEIQNVRLQNLATAPLCDTTFTGKIYHNTTDTHSYICNGTDWEQIDEEPGASGGTLQPYLFSVTPSSTSINTTSEFIIIGGNFDEDTVFTLGNGATLNSVVINSDKQATLNITAGATEMIGIPITAKNDTLDDFGFNLTIDIISWQLFAITDSTKCAESLPYGPNPITESDSAYFSTANQDTTHTKFKQVLTVDGVTKFEILYDFGNSKTLKDRFNTAFVSGESVNWTVTENGATYTYGPHLWYYSDGASLSTKWDGAASTSRFSNDDGSWGAAPNNVDGNGGPYETWGQGNHNSGDSTWCGTYVTNGVSTTSSTIKNFMYMQ